MENGRRVGRGLGAQFILKAPLIVFCWSYSPCLLVHVYPGLKERAGHSDWLGEWKPMQADGPEDLCFLFDVHILLDLDREVWDGGLWVSAEASVGTESSVFGYSLSCFSP